MRNWWECFLGEKMPGVGISIGLTRLISRLLKAGILNTLSATPAQVMVVNMQEDLMPIYLNSIATITTRGN